MTSFKGYRKVAVKRGGEVVDHMKMARSKKGVRFPSSKKRK